MLASHGFWHACRVALFCHLSWQITGDGAGGRLATKASLQHAYKDHILTELQLFQFAVNDIKGMHFCFVALEEQEQEAKLLDGCLARSRTVPGTQKLHCFIPFSPNTLEVKLFSSSHSVEKKKGGSRKCTCPPSSSYSNRWICHHGL